MGRKLNKVKKQSFFKVLVGDFSKHLRIPPAFIKNLNGRSLRRCVIRDPSRKLRTVELEERENGLFFCEGWQGFVKDNLLQAGDLLVFRYDGEAKFKVKIYDRSACEKDVEVAERSGSSVSLENNGNQTRVKDEIVDFETENCKEDCENKATIANRSGNVMSGKKPTAEYVKETSTCISFKSENPCFMLKFKKPVHYCVVIPKNLAIAEGLMRRKDVMLQNQTGRSWLVKLVTRPKSSKNRVELTTGWGECCKANQISPGDTVIFEFVKQSIIQIHIFRAVRGKRCCVVIDAPNVKTKASSG